MEALRSLFARLFRKPIIDFAAAFHGSPVPLAILDNELRFVACNERFAHLNGKSVQSHIGRHVAELLPATTPKTLLSLRNAFGNQSRVSENTVQGSVTTSPDDRQLDIEAVTPLYSSAGTAQHILVSTTKVIDWARAGEAASTSGDWLALAQERNPDPFGLLRAIRDESGVILDFEFEYANRAADQMAHGRKLTGNRLLEMFPGAAIHPQIFPRYVHLIEQNSGDAVELPYDNDGVSGWYRNSSVAIGDDRLAVNYRDITERKRLEEELRTVGTEYRHRLQNLITVVAALVRQSAKSATDVKALSEDLCLRLFAMAVAQGLLSPLGDQGSLTELVIEVLEPFAGSTLAIDPGPEIHVPHSGAVGLALALNELATNAAKYGALSTTEGMVQLGWEVSGTRVTLTWEETGGPDVTPPQKSGLGTRLIQDVALRLHHGEVKMDFAATGLIVHISFDLE